MEFNYDGCFTDHLGVNFSKNYKFNTYRGEKSGAIGDTVAFEAKNYVSFTMLAEVLLKHHQQDYEIYLPQHQLFFLANYDQRIY